MQYSMLKIIVYVVLGNLLLEGSISKDDSTSQKDDEES